MGFSALSTDPLGFSALLAPSTAPAAPAAPSPVVEAVLSTGGSTTTGVSFGRPAKLGPLLMTWSCL